MADFRVTVLPVTVLRQNCTVVYDPASREALVFDPGGEPGRILNFLLRQGLTVQRILLTHGHLDHAGGAAALKGTLDAQRAARGRAPVEIWGPEEHDRFLLEQIERQQEALGLTGMRNVLPDRWLADGDVVAWADWRFEVLHCPGHTPGGVVYVERRARFAVVGDVLFQGSIGRADFVYGDAEALIGGIKNRLLPLGDDIRFICGHGPGSTFGAERQNNPFLV
jgi:glyoxylase-like metal-dependent hydrolase (beta-lactamase superfamily II)